MSRVSTAFLLALFAGAAGPRPVFGQSHALDRGSILIGGEASLTSTSQKVDGFTMDDVIDLTLAPSAQYFALPGLAVGGGVTVRHGDEGRWELGIGPTVTYFFGTGERTWAPYVSGSFAWGRIWQDRWVTEPSWHGYRAAAGMEMFLASGIGLHTEAFYRYRQYNRGIPEGFDPFQNEAKSEVTVLGLAVGFSIFLF